MLTAVATVLLAVSPASVSSPGDAPQRPRAMALLPSTYSARREEPYRGGPIPENARVARHENAAWIIAGAVIGMSAYGIAAAVGIIAGPLVAIANDDPSLLPLMIPLLGPFLSFGLHVPTRYTENQSSTMRTMFLLDGVAQLGGVAMLAIAYATRSTVLVFDEEEVTASVSLGGGATPASVSFQLRWP